jgi:hypothetical protein
MGGRLVVTDVASPSSPDVIQADSLLAIQSERGAKSGARLARNRKGRKRVGETARLSRNFL